MSTRPVAVDYDSRARDIVVPTHVGPHTITVTISNDEGRIVEVLIANAPPDIRGLCNGLSRTVSGSLQCGVGIDRVIKMLRYLTEGGACTPTPGPYGFIKSIPDAVAVLLEREVERLLAGPQGACSCGLPLSHSEPHQEKEG